MANGTQIIRLMQGDCIERMRAMPEGSVGQIITDPPYLIDFMNKEWDSVPSDTETVVLIESETESEVDHAPSTEELHEHDAWHQAWLKEALRVLRRGGQIKAFSATRTFHRLASTMETVGFVLETDALEAWGQGQGFPKSLNLSKSIDSMLGAADQREIVGTKRGVGGENMNDIVNGRETIRTTDDPGGKGVGAYGTGAKQVGIDIPVTKAATQEAAMFEGYGTALKPSWEPFIVGRKP